MSPDPKLLLAAQVTAFLREREPACQSWNVELIEAREGYSRARMAIRHDMLNGHGTVHGGMIFALADTAFAYACNSRNVRTVAAQASISFLSPAFEGEVLFAEAQEQAVVGRTGAYAVHVTAADGRPIAEFQGLSRSLGGPVFTDESERNKND